MFEIDSTLEITILNFHPVFPLKFYALQPYTDYMLNKAVEHKNNVYWKDEKAPRGYGPFPTMYLALEHYKDIILERRNPLPDNVVQVDFSKKP